MAESKLSECGIYKRRGQLDSETQRLRSCSETMYHPTSTITLVLAPTHHIIFLSVPTSVRFAKLNSLFKCWNYILSKLNSSFALLEAI